MKLFLDTEFNGFGGKLISMALVPEEESTRCFYREIEMRDQLDPWVKQNVVPHLLLAPCSYDQFQTELQQYLNEIGDCTIVADWPDDIRHLCDALITGPGTRIACPNLKFVLDFSISYQSDIPHNALYDAMAIRKVYLGRNSK